jgi:hypothetical protein
MKKSIVPGILSMVTAALFCLLPHFAFGQGKNEITVTNKEGGPLPGISVHIFESKSGKCTCFMGVCIPAPFDQDVTDKHGKASFKGGKNRPDLKPNIDYVASIDDKCMTVQQRQCNNATQDCSFSATWYMFTTDKNGKFDGFVIKK